MITKNPQVALLVEQVIDGGIAEVDVLLQRIGALGIAPNQLENDALHAAIHFLSDADLRSTDPAYGIWQIGELKRLLERVK